MIIKYITFLTGIVWSYSIIKTQSVFDKKAGLIFKSNTKDKLFEKLLEFKKLDKDKVLKMKFIAKKNCSKFTMFNHFLKLKYIINENY